MSEHHDEANPSPTSISDTGKDIKKRMDRYEDKMKSALGEGEAAAPVGDSTRSEE